MIAQHVAEGGVLGARGGDPESLGDVIVLNQSLAASDNDIPTLGRASRCEAAGCELTKGDPNIQKPRIPGLSYL